MMVIVYRDVMYAKPLEIVQSLYSKPKGQVITGGIYVFNYMFMHVNTMGNNLRLS